MNSDAGTTTVHALSVTLQHVRPAVRRRLEVPSGLTLDELDAVLMLAFGWEGGHLHQFEVGQVVYGPDALVEDAFGGMFARQALRHEDDAVLGRVLPLVGDAAVWVYDLGDDWRHRIEVTAVTPAEPDTIYPRCSGGSGLAPEEDSGRQRRGGFGADKLAKLNAALAEGLGEFGRDLAGGVPDADEVFDGLFPELEPVADGEACHCDECACGQDACFGGDLGTLPVLEVRPDGELAAAAAASPLVSRAVALAEWLGDGRALTSSKVLRPADVQDVVAKVGLDRPVLPPVGGGAPSRGRSGGTRGGGTREGGAPWRSAKDNTALQAIWRAAVSAGLIEIRGQKALPGPGLAVWTAPVEPARRLDNWAQLLAGYLRVLAEADRESGSWLLRAPGATLPASVVLLYTAAEAPVWPGVFALGGLLFEDEADGDGDPRALLDLPTAAARWIEILQQWAVAGIVVAASSQDFDEIGAAGEELEELMAELRKTFGVTGRGRSPLDHLLEPAFQAMRQGPFAEVTPFGRYCLARILRDQGLVVPTLGDQVDVPPGQLLIALHDRDPASVAQEVRVWLEARGEAWEVAAQELVRSATVMDEAGPPRRSVMPAVVRAVAEGYPERAGELLDEWQTHPLLAAAVAVGRFSAGQGPRPGVEQFLWIAFDGLSMALDEEDSFAELIDVLELGLLLAEPGVVGVAVRVDHPQADAVLRLLIRHLDDQTLAARLRRAMKGRR